MLPLHQWLKVNFIYNFKYHIHLYVILKIGKTPEEIRKIFNIVNDFTPEEEAQVREDNKLCEDA